MSLKTINRVLIVTVFGLLFGIWTINNSYENEVRKEHIIHITKDEWKEYSLTCTKLCDAFDYSFEAIRVREKHYRYQCSCMFTNSNDVNYIKHIDL